MAVRCRGNSGTRELRRGGCANAGSLIDVIAAEILPTKPCSASSSHPVPSSLTTLLVYLVTSAVCCSAPCFPASWEARESLRRCTSTSLVSCSLSPVYQSKRCVNEDTFAHGGISAPRVSTIASTASHSSAASVSATSKPVTLMAGCSFLWACFSER